jgi:tetratricopeptide (TPR) repeat protein
MTDAIISDLSLVPDLRVISHASVFQYRGAAPEPRSIGQKLNVDAVLTGRMKQVDSTLVLSLELTATSDGRRLWGQQYTRNVADRAQLQQDVASEVADALRLGLTPTGRQQIRGYSTVDAEAQQLYLKGRYYFFKETPEDVLRARTLFQQAIDRDPTFALAYSALGDSYDWMATEGFQPLREVLGLAQAAKAKATELNPSLAEVQASNAGLDFLQWDWAKADTGFQRALQLNPNYFEGHHLYSIYLRSMRRFPEAIRHAALADRLNPLSMPARSNLALTYYYARQYEVAAAQYRLSIKDDPKAAGPRAGLAAVLYKMGREKEAFAEWQEALSLTGDEEAALRLGRTYSREGARAAQAFILKAELESLTGMARNEYVSPVEFAFRYALLNDKENAFRWLERAYIERSPQLFNLNVDPDYDSLRDDARFTDLVSRLHLPQ